LVWTTLDLKSTRTCRLLTSLESWANVNSASSMFQRLLPGFSVSWSTAFLRLTMNRLFGKGCQVLTYPWISEDEVERVFLTTLSLSSLLSQSLSVALPGWQAFVRSIFLGWRWRFKSSELGIYCFRVCQTLPHPCGLQRSFVGRYLIPKGLSFFSAPFN
jgi:hypothetical protein